MQKIFRFYIEFCLKENNRFELFKREIATDVSLNGVEMYRRSNTSVNKTSMRNFDINFNFAANHSHWPVDGSITVERDIAIVKYDTLNIYRRCISFFFAFSRCIIAV